MRLFARAAMVLAGIALIAGPVAYVRARHPDLPPSPQPVAAELLPTAEPPVPDPSIRITDELIRAREIRSATPPVPTSVRARPISRARLQRGSVLARLFLGNGDYRPRPFPRPRS